MFSQERLKEISRREEDYIKENERLREELSVKQNDPAIWLPDIMSEAKKLATYCGRCTIMWLVYGLLIVLPFSQFVGQTRAGEFSLV